MHYLLRHEIWRYWFRAPKSKIWDTQVAEYVLTGQTHKYASLNELALKYGGTLKDDKIKEYWDNGYMTEDIPPRELEEYALGDVDNTEIVFLGQIELAEQQGQLDLIMAMMESRMATIDMEHNGFAFDKAGASVKRLAVSQAASDEWASAQLIMNMLAPDGVEVDVTSSLQLSKFLLGGIHKFKKRVYVVDPDGQRVKYKGGAKKGQYKTRLETVSHNFNADPRLDFHPPSTEAVANDGWKLNDKVLKEVIGQLKIDGVDHECIEMLTHVRNAREIQKDLTAFYSPYLDLTWGDSCLHPSFSHTATDTGRLSCTSPNIQQVSGADKDENS
jgi:DNA polymerase I-like protein with 3'-5' exonuclease and polymerase domains